LGGSAQEKNDVAGGEVVWWTEKRRRGSVVLGFLVGQSTLVDGNVVFLSCVGLTDVLGACDVPGLNHLLHAKPRQGRSA
jgi:hypothetical protein